MSSFSLHIATDNAAFNGRTLPHEIARQLVRVANQLDREKIDRDDSRYGSNTGSIVDSNGNVCGRWYWTGREQRLDDGAALDAIVAHLDDLAEWEADTIEDVAEIVTSTGRKLDPGTAHA